MSKSNKTVNKELRTLSCVNNKLRQLPDHRTNNKQTKVPISDDHSDRLFLSPQFAGGNCSPSTKEESTSEPQAAIAARHGSPPPTILLD
jgi:hypothetical protein